MNFKTAFSIPRRVPVSFLISSLTAAAVAFNIFGVTSSLATNDAPATPSQPVVMKNALVWQLGSLLQWQPLSTLGVNIVHTFPNPAVTDGFSPGGEKPMAMTQEAIDTLWRDEVAQLHTRGIRVWAGAASTCFVPQRFKNYGMDPEKYFARDPEGKPSPMLGGSFGTELMTGCYNNPNWMGLLRDTAVAYADAGFDGIWWDVGGYGDPPVYFCHCDHCRKDWKDYLRQVNLPDDTIQPIKEGGWDFTKRVNREHFRWRLALYEKNFRAIRDAVKARNPDFVFMHNEEPLWMESYSTAVTHLHDVPQCEEYGHSAAPFSLLPNYFSGRALTKSAPLTLVQNDNPKRNSLQHRIALAEAYAAGGVLMNRNFPEDNQTFYKYLEAYNDLYVNQESMADVAVLFSFWSRFFYEIGQTPPHDAPRPQYWMGWMLQDLHVPYDYLFVEKSFALEDLQRYRVLILSDLAVLDDKHLDVLHEYIQRGGRILATHNTAKYDLEMQDRGRAGLMAITGRSFEDGEQLTVANGRWVYLPNNAADEYNKANPRHASEKTALSPPAPPPPSITKPLDWILEDVMPVSIEAKNTTAIVPQRQNGRILLHLINYNMYPDGQKLTPDEHIKIRVNVPDSMTVRGAKALSPDWDWYEREVAMERKPNYISVTIDKLDTYALIVVETGT